MDLILIICGKCGLLYSGPKFCPVCQTPAGHPLQTILRVKQGQLEAVGMGGSY